MTANSNTSTPQSDDPTLHSHPANPAPDEPVTDEQIKAKIIQMMLDDRGIGQRQIKREGLVQVVPSEYQHRAKKIIDELATDPSFPLIEKPDDRDVYIIPSRQLKTAFRLYEKYTGEPFETTTEHVVDSEPDPVEVTFRTKWEDVNTVDHTLETTALDLRYDVDYTAHPVEFVVTAIPDVLEDLQDELSDALQTAVELD